MILRALAILLLCMNLGAAAWWWWHPATAVSVPEPPPPAGVTRLQLLSERPAGLAEVPEALTGECRSLGPFARIEALRDAMRVLAPSVQSIQVRELPHARLVGYRVYLPAAPSREAALTRTSQLAARGVRDYYLVTAGEQQNVISLGLFRELGNAERRRAELKAKGFAVVLEPRTEDGQQWWIDLVAAPDFDWRSALGAGAEDGLESQPCAGSAPAQTPSQDPPETPGASSDAPPAGATG